MLVNQYQFYEHVIYKPKINWTAGFQIKLLQ